MICGRRSPDLKPEPYRVAANKIAASSSSSMALNSRLMLAEVTATDPKPVPLQPLQFHDRELEVSRELKQALSQSVPMSAFGGSR
jgi:hypothetical protein